MGLHLKLTDINLSHNRITAVHKSFFENVKANLQTINLGHNLLEEVPASGPLIKSFNFDFVVFQLCAASEC